MVTVLCDGLPYELRVPAKPGSISLHPWGSAASSAHYSELCPSDKSIFRGTFLAWGMNFLSVGFGHMAPIDFNGSHAARNPCAPLGLHSPLTRVDCLTLSFNGESTPPPCLAEKKPGPLSTLTPTPLALCVCG